MKKFLSLGFAAALLIALAGCAGNHQSFDLEDTAKVKICAYDASSTEPFATVIVDGSEDVDALVEHFSSLPLKEQEYVEPSALGYELFFQDSSGEQLAKLSLPYGPSPWIDCGGDAYVVTEGAVDTDYLSQLIDIAVSTGPEVK